MLISLFVLKFPACREVAIKLHLPGYCARQSSTFRRVKPYTYRLRHSVQGSPTRFTVQSTRRVLYTALGSTVSNLQ